MNDFTDQLPLGKTTVYKSEYDPGLLCLIPRHLKRTEIGLPKELPFHGVDIWNAYEMSWLTPQGKPVVAMGEFRIPCESPNLIESKSLKLYLNSFNQTRFDDFESVRALLSQDLGGAAGTPVDVRLNSAAEFSSASFANLPGECLDDLDIKVEGYSLTPGFLEGATEPTQQVAETLHSHLLKSNCLVTSQPDWASILIRYQGAKINHEALLRYLISFRQHNEFHEQCVERIYTDLMRFCQPQQLSVYARYTRRGGLDINPYRSNCEYEVENLRLARQ
jgi:7-cyano-7-deazaguanine reductase